jgi:hypothetical protein
LFLDVSPTLSLLLHLVNDRNRLPAITAFAALRILDLPPTRVGFFNTASKIGLPSAVVSSHCTLFLPAATKRFAASTALIPLLNKLGRPCSLVLALVKALISEGASGSEGVMSLNELFDTLFFTPPRLPYELVFFRMGFFSALVAMVELVSPDTLPIPTTLPGLELLGESTLPLLPRDVLCVLALLSVLLCEVLCARCIGAVRGRFDARDRAATLTSDPVLLPGPFLSENAASASAAFVGTSPKLPSR